MAVMGDLRAELSLDSSRFNRSINKAKKAVSKFGGSLGGLKSQLVGVLGVAALGGFVKSTLASADAIGKFADRIGVSISALQEWRFAFDKAGISQAQVDKGLLNFVKALGEARQGTGTLVTFLNKYDKGLLNSLVTAENSTDALNIFFRTLGKVKNQSDKVALASGAMGRAGKEMVAAFNDGTTAFDGWIEKAREYDLIISDDLIRNAEKLNDDFSTLTEILNTQLQKAFLNLAPQINKVVTGMTKFTQLVKELDTPSTLNFFERLSLLSAAGGLGLMKSFYKDVYGLEGISNRIGEAQSGLFGILDQGEKGAIGSESNPGKISFNNPKVDTSGGLSTGLNMAGDKGSKFQEAIFKNSMKMAKARKENLKVLLDLGQALVDEIDLLEIEASGNKELLELTKEKIRIETASNIKLDEGQVKRVAAFVREKARLEEIIEANREAGSEIQTVWENVGRATEDALVDAALNAGDAMEGLRNIAQSVLSDITRMLIRSNITEPLFGAGGGISSFIKGIDFGGFLAAGGPTQGGKSYMVGENGPELFTPGGSGFVTPNNELGGGPNISLNVTTGVAPTVRAELMNLMPQIVAQTKRAVAEGRLRGGSFAKSMGG